MNGKIRKPIMLAIFAAVFYGVSAPFSKMLLVELQPPFLAALLYLGAGIGIFFVRCVRDSRIIEKKEAYLTKSEIPFAVAMIALDIAAAVLLMAGLKLTSSANVSLLSNFEIAATAMVALLIFKEPISKKLWIAIVLITISTFILSVDDIKNFTFSLGTLIVLIACVCWGFENNCTRMLAEKDPMTVVVIKGFGCGGGSLIIAMLLKEYSLNAAYIIAALLLGFVSYGLSVFFYVSAQRTLGAAKTSAFYAIAPFVGVALSFLTFNQVPTLSFLAALLLMGVGVYFTSSDRHRHFHSHEPIVHAHMHNHDDGHHIHVHEPGVPGEHCHTHTHEGIYHEHTHTQDTHHAHAH